MVLHINIRTSGNAHCRKESVVLVVQLVNGDSQLELREDFQKQLYLSCFLGVICESIVPSPNADAYEP